MAFLRYRFRVYPTRPQRIMLARTFGCVRTVFNDAVAARKAAFEAGQPFPTEAELSKRLLTEAKRTPERAWLSEVSNAALQQSLRDCETAYRNFFASRSGKRKGRVIAPPRFKRRSARQSARFTRKAFALRENGRLYLAKIGDLKVAWSRELPNEPSSVTVIKTASGKYFVSMVVPVSDAAPIKAPHDGADTGIDLGLTDFAVLRGGKVIESPKFFRGLERRIKKAQRELSRKQGGSKNRDKARIRVAKLHERHANQRKDFLRQRIHDILRENQSVYVEDLNVAGLAKGRAAKSFHDQALGRFLVMLEATARARGRGFVKVHRYFPSTRLCSSCKHLTGPRGREGLRIRVWECSHCRARHDRDSNAERNIRDEGRRLFAEGRSSSEESETGELKRLWSRCQTGECSHPVLKQEPIRSGSHQVQAGDPCTSKHGGRQSNSYTYSFELDHPSQCGPGAGGTLVT